jgi:hypothetical protein
VTLIARPLAPVARALTFGGNRAGKTMAWAVWDRVQTEMCDRIASGFRARVDIGVLLAMRGAR